MQSSLKEESKQAKAIVKKVESLVEEFSLQSPISNQKPPSRIKGWSPPCEGRYKVNVDRAVFKETGSCGIGVVIRNDRGQIMGAKSKKLELPLGAMEVEAKAFMEGMLLEVDLRLKHVILEGDAQVVTNALSGSSPPLPSSIQMIIEGAKRWKQDVYAWRVNHVCKAGNLAAHLMARNAKIISDSVI